ncbi:MAG TPA: hypothetical protein VN641_10365 [Urbifossiella sp.]|nr:hypothetical protein [Urbifossiella sp.]
MAESEPADLLPALYTTSGPSCWQTRPRSFGLFALQLEPAEAAAL